MSLNVEYVFKVLDRFSGPLDRMAGRVNKFNDRIAKSTENLKKMGQGIAKTGAIMSAAITLPIAMMGKKFIDAASDAEETRSKFATIFKDISDNAENTADSFAKNFGLAGTTARQLLGDTGDMLSGFGFTSEAALKLSKRTNELAVDLASFTNFSGGAEGASAALTKALLGERESVKSLGIAILEEDVKKKVALMRSQGMRFASMREAKAYATLEIAISQSKNAIGDYARTKKSFANVQRRVFENNKEMAESFGKLLIPYATKILNIIDNLQNELMGLSDTQKKWVLIVGGTVAALGPLLLLIGGIILALPMMGAAIPVVAIGALIAVCVALGKVLFDLIWTLGEISFYMGQTLWEAIKLGASAIKGFFISAFEAVKSYLISWVTWFNDIIGGVVSKIQGITGAVSKFTGVGSDKNASNTADNAARKSEQRIAVNGTVNGEMTINQGGTKTKAPLTGNLGGQMAGAY